MLAHALSIGSTSITGQAGPATIGGVPLGTAGTGTLAGYTLMGGEDFSDSLSSAILRPGQPYGRLLPNFSERDRRLTSPSSMHAACDPYWTGWQDANDGVPIASLSDMLTQSSSVLTLRTRLGTAPEQALFGTRTQGSGPAYTNRPIASTGVTLFGSYGARGDRWTKIRWRGKPGMTTLDAGNVNQAIWWLNIRGGSELGSTATGEWNDEIDGWESTATASPNRANVIARAVGSGTSSTSFSIAADAWNVTYFKIGATTVDIQNYDDNGTLLTSTSMANSATNQDQLYYVLFDSIANVQNAQGDVFDVTRWASVQSTLEIDYVQEWLVTGATVLQPLIADAAPYTIALGGTGSIVLPSAASLWGTTPDSEYIRFLSGYDTNGPGRTDDQTSPQQTRDSLPPGVTYNSGTRTLSFSATFSAKPGVIHGYVYPKKSTAGISKPYRFAVYVSPKLVMPSITLPVAGQAYSYVIPRGSPRNWDNGNCPHGSHSGLTLQSGPTWLSYDTATRTLSGNCPADFTSATLVFRCTNGAGIYTEQTVVLTQTFMQDTFTDVDGTNLLSHVGEIGATWSSNVANPSTQKIGGNSVMTIDANGGGGYSSGVPSGVNQDITAVFKKFSTISDETCGFSFMESTSANTKYWVRYNEAVGGWQLFKTVAGTSTNLTPGTTIVQAFTAATSKTVKVEYRGGTGQIRVLVDAVEIINVTDTAITAIGRIGMRSTNPTTAQTASTGIHIDSLLGLNV